jgi:hypothetical protein
VTSQSVVGDRPGGACVTEPDVADAAKKSRQLSCAWGRADGAVLVPSGLHWACRRRSRRPKNQQHFVEPNSESKNPLKMKIDYSRKKGAVHQTYHDAVTPVDATRGYDFFLILTLL